MAETENITTEKYPVSAAFPVLQDIDGSLNMLEFGINTMISFVEGGNGMSNDAVHFVSVHLDDHLKAVQKKLSKVWDLLRPVSDVELETL